MNEVLVKINELKDTLEVKSAKSEKTYDELCEKQAKVDVIRDQQFKKARELSARESKYKGFDDFIAKEKGLEANIAQYSANMEQLKVKQTDLSFAQEKLAEDQKVLNQERDAFSKKTILIKERESKLMIKEQTVQDLVSGKSFKKIQ